MIAYKISEQKWVTVDPSMVRTHHILVDEKKDKWSTQIISNYYMYKETKKSVIYTCGHVYTNTDTEKILLYVYADGSISYEKGDYVTYEYMSPFIKTTARCMFDKYYHKKAHARRLMMSGTRKESELRKFIALKVTEEQIVNRCCWGCRLGREHANDIVSHGLEAYSSVKNFAETLSRIDKIVDNSHWEICCANKNTYLGDIGILGKGKINTYFPVDACSYKQKDGKRAISNIGIMRVKRYLNLIKEGKNREEVFKELYIKHDEYWVSEFSPTAIWINCDKVKALSTADRVLLQEKAKQYNIAVFIVDNNDWMANGGKSHIIGTINWNMHESDMIFNIEPETVYKLIETGKYDYRTVENLKNKYIFNKNYNFYLSPEQVEIIKSNFVHKKHKNSPRIGYKDVFKSVRAAFETTVSLEEIKQAINTMVYHKYLCFRKGSNGYITFYVTRKCK